MELLPPDPQPVEKPKETWFGWAMNVLKKEATSLVTEGVQGAGGYFGGGFWVGPLGPQGGG
jgi:hypothetical protein